jgi:hypothetical protein
MNHRSSTDWDAWLETIEPSASQAEAWRGIQCFFRWIELRAMNGHAVPSFLLGLEEDVKHSSLLRRLIDGKEPFPLAPPESYKQPWYELMENGQAIAREVAPWPWDAHHKLEINKGIWTILKRFSDVEYIVAYRETQVPYHLIRAGQNWHIRKLPAPAPEAP